MAETKAKAGRGQVWTDDERAAMQEGARERKSAPRAKGNEREEGERAIREKVAEMPEPDRSMAERIHELVTTAAPDLVPRTYYGMPAYARDGKTICFFKPASKFKERHATFGFEQHANLDDGAMWPVAFNIAELTPEVEARIAELVKRAVS